MFHRSLSLPLAATVFWAVIAWAIPGAVPAAEQWQIVLQENIVSDYSKTRRDALKQVETNTAKGLRAIWNVLEKLAPKDPMRYDWYVREGAYEALLKAEGEEAEEEIRRVLEGSGNASAKEAIVYSLIWKLRQQFEKEYGGNDERKVEEAKYLLSKRRGVEYFALVLPVLQKFDPERKRLAWIHTAFADRNPTARLAAIQGMIAYPDNSSVELLLKHLQKLEKQKARHFKEWVFARYALETLTGQYYRDSVEDWLKWWEGAKHLFSIEKRVEEETAKDGEGEGKGETAVVRTGGIEVRVQMKVAGVPDGYPLVVLPSIHYEPEYFRPYFHGIEEFARVYYIQMPQIQDFKGLPRQAESNLIVYPTEVLAGALAELMKESGPEQYALMGHGPGASTLAMYMAAKFPARISGMVLINPATAGSEYSNAIDNVEREGRRRRNPEIVNGAKHITLGRDGKPTYEPADDAEAGGLHRALSNLRYADPSSPEIGTRSFLYSISGGQQTLNDQNWSLRSIFKGESPPVPVLVVYGERDPWCPAVEISRIEQFFRKATVARFPRSAQNPFMFETYRFTKEVERFLLPIKSATAAGK